LLPFSLASIQMSSTNELFKFISFLTVLFLTTQRYASKTIKGSIDADFGLVFKKTFESKK